MSRQTLALRSGDVKKGLMVSEAPVRILVVDDNAATQYSTSRILRSAGHAVTTAGTGFEALDIVNRSAPDLVVLDINLPDIDGFEICRRLRADAATSRTPVVYLSATFVDDVDKAHGVDAGADGYLTHPVEAPVLIATVNALLRARRAEAAVELSEARFKAIFDNVLNGIALLSDDLVFIDVNPSMCRVLGRERDAVVGRHLSAFNVKEHQPDLSAMASALQTSGEWRGTAPVLNAKGEHVELEWSVSTHTVPHLRLAIVADITGRMLIEADRQRLLESERIARAQAEEANRLKDDFLAALSHELRTPLNAIVGFARLLQRSPIVAADERTLTHVNAIERNAWVQAQLISDLLDISRITSGKLELQREAMSAADAIDGALASIQTSARAKRVTIDVDLDRTLEPVWWDPSRFQQVVWNLIDNAVKFSPVGGLVTVTLRATPTMIELTVVDRGRGISDDFLPHVFDRFRQEDSTSRRGHGGLGLGLAIVHQLVTAHKGTITAASEGEDRGATFVVRLPRISAADSPADGQGLRPDAAIDLTGRRILIVDDNEDARTLLRDVLSGVSARVMDAPSSDAAVEALTVFDPHLLISDLAMPNQDGYDLIRRVRALGWSADRLPAIALSAFARDEDRERSLQAGYQAHIGKPPDVATLLDQVVTLIR
jgi:PAS domain S-box-containing protein